MTSSKSTLSGVVWDVLRDLGLIPSPTRVCEDVGVGRGELDAPILGFADSPMFSGMDDVLMGGKEVEKKVEEAKRLV